MTGPIASGCAAIGALALLAGSLGGCTSGVAAPSTSARSPGDRSTTVSSASPGPSRTVVPLAVSRGRLVSCRVTADRHSAVASVRLTNTASTAATYTAQVQFRTKAARTPFGTAIGTFDDLAAHAARTVPIIAARSAKTVGTVSCTVVAVARVR